MKIVALSITLGLALVGCKQKEQAAPTSAPPPTVGVPGDATTGSATAGSAAVGSAASAEAEIDVPTEVDFEDQANTDITDKNVEAHVKAIEQDLAGSE